MADAGGIKAGRAYVEIGTNDSALAKGLGRAEARLKAFGDSVQAVGKSFLAFGALAAAPFAGAARSFASFDDALASLRSAANPTADELVKIRSAIGEISRATGTGPAKVAAAMTELLKAGLPLEGVLGGATQAALQFARVAEMDVAEAATTLTDAMNVFGADATKTVDVLSKAADASSISVRDVAQAFSMVGAVAKQAGMGIEETANAIAVLGQNGVKGSDAGTSLKTMLLRLQTGAESAGDQMKELGINVRNADGSMKTMRGVVGELESKLAGLSGEARDKALLKLFGSDAIRAGSILIGKGVKGLDEFSAAMAKGLPVAEKFGILMDTLSGHAQVALAALQRLGAEVGGALAPTFRAWGQSAAGVLGVLAELAKNNNGLIVSVAKGVAAVAGIGAAIVAFAVAAKVAAVAFGVMGTVLNVVTAAVAVTNAGFRLLTVTVNLASAATAVFSSLGAVLAAVATPAGVIAIALAGVAYWLTQTEGGSQALAQVLGSLGGLFGALKETAVAAFGGIAEALKAGDLAAASKILWAALKVEWLTGVDFLKGVWDDWGAATVEGFRAVSFQFASLMTDAWAGVQSGFVNAIGFLKETFGGFVSYLMKEWNDYLAFFKGVWAHTRAIATGQVFDHKAFGAELNRIEDERKAANAKADDRGPDRRARAEQLAGIERDREAAQKALGDHQAAEVAARRGGAGPSAELEKARRELQDALDAAKPKPGQARTPAELAKERIDAKLAGLSVETPGGAGAGQGLTPEGLDGALEQASAKVDVKGSFSAAAARGLGAGDSVREQVDEQKKTNQKLDRIDDRLRKTGAPVASEP